MIPMPQPVVRGQVLTADTINNIITSLRMLRPIGGAGILVEESINGVIFKLAERPKEPSFVFDHRWKCSLISSSDSGGNPQYDLAIRPGSFYLITEDGLEEQVLELSDNLNEREEGGWESTGNALGADVTLYLAVNDQGDGYKLILGTEEEGWTPLFKIATITGAGSSYDIPVITQLLLQDVYYWAVGMGDSWSRWTAAWKLRIVEQTIEDTTTGTTTVEQHLEIFAPLWVVGQTEYLATFNGVTLQKGWNDLGLLADGEWFAALHYVPAESSDYETTEAQTLVELLQAKPTENLEQYTLVSIATLADGTLTQYHLGVIVERTASGNSGTTSGSEQTFDVVTDLEFQMADSGEGWITMKRRTITATVTAMGEENSSTLLSVVSHRAEHEEMG